MKLKRIASKLHQAISPQARSRALQIAITSELKRAIEIPQPDFSARLILPDGFGRGLLERVPELLLAYLACRDGVRILDIGHANAAQSHLNMISLLPSAVEITAGFAMERFQWQWVSRCPGNQFVTTYLPRQCSQWPAGRTF